MAYNGHSQPLLLAFCVNGSLIVVLHKTFGRTTVRNRIRRALELFVYVPIGGIQQWVQISSGDTSNPVLLFLHGGPGGTSRPAAVAWKPWEEYFTVVHWDQRGAGQTF